MIRRAKQETSPAPVDSIRGLGYRADVDGMRGVAILLVLLFHAGVPWMKGGYSGVDIFFVISGYLIGFQVSSELLQQRFALLAFYEKRVRRILPALLVVILFTLLAGWILFDGRELRVLGEQAGSAAVSLSNVYYWKTTSYFSPNAHLQTLLMTWSLAIEVQFYLLLPLLALALRNRARRLYLCLIFVLLFASLGYAIAGMKGGWPGAFFLLGGRWWELSAGVVLGTVQTFEGFNVVFLGGVAAEICGALGLLGVAASMALPEPAAHLLVPPVCIPVAAAVLLCLGANSWINREVLASRAISGLGRRSYSLYLWHWPLLSLGYLCGAGYLAPRGRLVLLVLTFLSAEASYRCIELPFRRTRNRTRALQVIAGMGALVLLISGTFILSHGFPKRRPAASTIEETVRGDVVARMCLMEDGGSIETLPVGCTSSAPGVALLGDSHAAALSPAVRDLNPGLQMLMKSSCPPLLGVTIRGSGPDRCSEFERDAVARIAAERSVRTVVVAGYWLNPVYDATNSIRYVTTQGYDTATTEEESWKHLQDGLLALCLALRVAGKEVVLVEDVPISTYDPHLLAVGNTIPVRAQWGRWLALSPSWSEYESHPRTSEEIRIHSLLVKVATQSESNLVSFYDPLCNGASCKVIDRGMPLFEDRQHLSVIGARSLLRSSRLANVLDADGGGSNYGGSVGSH